MKPVFHKKVQKFILKIKDQKLYNLLRESVDGIIKDPSIGKILEHPFRKYQIRSQTIVYKNNSYRIAYTISTNKKELLFLLIDSRENFYKKLEKLCK